MNLELITALLTLTAMEIVLGIDNIIFIAILVDKLPAHQREKIRRLGIILALIMRLGLLFSLSWIMGLTEPLFSLLSKNISGRDLILLLGGLFLLAKSTIEIHHKIEGGGEATSQAENRRIASMGATAVLIQIILLDAVFSLDSVITAVGMVQNISIMVAAMLISMLVMLLSAKVIGDFVVEHPTLKILALSFLLMIGVMLVAEGMGQHIQKGYIYFAMFFSLIVEVLNMRYRKKIAAQKPAN